MIGTPTNLVLASATRSLLGQTIDFAAWLAVGVPLVAILLPLSWLYLTRVVFRVGGRTEGGCRDHVQQALRDLGPITGNERLVLTVFLCTALAWILRSTKQIGSFELPGLDQIWPSIDDSTIAIAGALLLFAWPAPDSKGREPLLTWDVARKVPWGVILLFGGGLSLARAFQESGLAESFAGWVAGIGGVSSWATLAAIVAGATLVTEFTSNTATAAMLMPLLASTAAATGQNPLGLMIGAAVACSFAFCLPVATPPNAVIYGSGRITIGEMIRAGAAMNLMAYVVWMVVLRVIVGPFFL